MKILFLHGWHSVPGGVKPTYLAEQGHQVINPALDDDDFDAAVLTAQNAYDQHRPDVVVGSSRGGAVALNISSADTPLVLLCPAWKRWGKVQTAKANTIILHSRADDTIPFADSEEILRASQLPSAALIEVGDDHRLADPNSLRDLRRIVGAFSKPASFSKTHPFAYHVVPLHALKPISMTRELLSKDDIDKSGIGTGRQTTSAVDKALGLSRFVHTYLPKCSDLRLDILPILDTQLKQSKTPPFPHAVFVIPTEELSDAKCAVCNFNAAVSRLRYGSVKGGNHTRGTSTDSVLKHWRGFRKDNPDSDRLRYSYWHEGIELPVIIGHEISKDLEAVGFKAKNKTELLLNSPFTLPANTRLFLFSESDAFSVRGLRTNWDITISNDPAFTWYASQDHVSPTIRQTIDSYFASETVSFPKLDFDRRR